MVQDVLELADKLWRGDIDTAELHPVGGFTGGVAEVAPGVAFVPSFANVSALTTDDGLVLVDTGSSFVAGAVHEALRGWSAQRLNTAIYSHGHIDHVFGVGVWEQESSTEGWPAPVVVAHDAVPARFDRYIVTAGYNEIINQRQFGVPGLRWPTEYRYPDRTYARHLELDVGGVAFELHHARGETDDHTWTWVPSSRVLCCGDLFIWASPNAGNPQKVQRYPREWAVALREMVALEPEVLLPGHGFPVVGAARVRQALTDTADLLDSLVDQTLALMNAGARLDEILHTVAAPAHLARPSLPATGVRRAGVRGAQRVAPLRRMVGREPVVAQARPRSRPGRGAGRPGGWGRRPGRPRPDAGRVAARGHRPDRVDAAGRSPGRAGGAGGSHRPGGPPGAGRGLHPARRRRPPRPWPKGCSPGPPGTPKDGPPVPAETPRSNYYSRITVG